MAVRVELPKELMRRALEKEKASTERAAKATGNPVIKDALQTEANTYNTAITSITEIK